MNKLFQVVGVFALAVLVVFLWRDQAGAATTVGDIIGWTADLVQQAIEKFSTFIQQF